mmetsp:Transcript_5244/g.8024  ORF Transcript_5244/g.8024 Transcript_5244/m.8024 type:complete len:126 (+) Transcript_5244:207-584(+)
MDLLGFISAIFPDCGGDIMDSNSDNIFNVSWFDGGGGDGGDIVDGDIVDIVDDGDVVDGDASGNFSARSMALWSKIRTLVAGNRASIGAQGLLIGGALLVFEFVGSMLSPTLPFMPASASASASV